MKTIVLNISRQKVWDEVAKTASYIGAKREVPDMYRRFLLTESAALDWQRFFEETASMTAIKLHKFLSAFTNDANGFSATLSLPDNFDDSLVESISTSIYSCFVSNIVGCWLRLIGEDPTSYFSDAIASIDNAILMLYRRKRPSRPSNT